MNTLKKKARLLYIDTSEVAEKSLVDAWVIRPGKLGTKDDEPGVALLAALAAGDVEIRILRSELLDLIGQLEEKYPEVCDCDGCVEPPELPKEDCGVDCCRELECMCADCEGCRL